MSMAKAEPVSSVAANANRTNLARPDQPDQEGVEMSQDRPAPATARVPTSQPATRHQLIQLERSMRLSESSVIEARKATPVTNIW